MSELHSIALRVAVVTATERGLTIGWVVTLVVLALVVVVFALALFHHEED